MSKQWGTPTWYFFHTFAEHMTDELYQKHSKEICNFYVSICKNLPCEYCTKHASQYVGRSLNPQNVPTRKQLMYYLFDFHNSVNVRNGKDIFNDYDIYKKAKLKPIFDLFKQEYTRTTNPFTGFQDSMYRKNVVHSIELFLKAHQHQIKWL